MGPAKTGPFSYLRILAGISQQVFCIVKRMKETALTLPLDLIDKHDIPIAGGKGANLGEMIGSGFPVPNGFVVTSTAYFKYVEETKIKDTIKHLFDGLDVNNPEKLFAVSKAVEHLIIRTPMPQEIEDSILESYKQIKKKFDAKLVAVRSSATAEDLPDASFAGQQETYLNITGEKELLQAVQKAWASLFTPRAIFYRVEKKFDHFKVGICIVVQKMVDSKVSGVMFSINPVNNDKNQMIIEAVLGLGEMIVQGKVTPDHFEVDKKSLTITNKIISTQTIEMVRHGKGNIDKKVPMSVGSKQKFSDHMVLQLAEIGKKLEHHYMFPQDSEWAYDGKKLYIVQTRPITTISAVQKKSEAIDPKAVSKLPVAISGAPASPGIASGKVVIVKNPKDIGKVKQGDVLLAGMTNPDYVPAMKKACAIVTDLGGRTSHAAIVSRELGIPAVVGTGNATKVLKEDAVVTVDGGAGVVYKGAPGGHHKEVPGGDQVSVVTQPTAFVRTATKVYCNLGEPELAPEIAKRHVDGVGLFRAEFMMAEIGTHPKKLLHEHKQKIFVEKLVDGMVKMASAFNPRPVVYRGSDFKTNEYRNLKGGAMYEPHEENPMIGYRGAFRYISDPKTFNLELEAMKIVRNKYGLRNLWLMIPFVRTVDELERVKKLVAHAGLHRSGSFRLWMMCEIPANVILLDDFIEAGIDGISVGSNDLTQLTMGVDRDNAEVAVEFDERNPAVTTSLRHVVKTCQKHKITSSICGQAPSVYPEITELLVEAGVTSVSVSPDMIDRTREIIAAAEAKLVHKKKS